MAADALVAAWVRRLVARVHARPVGAAPACVGRRVQHARASAGAKAPEHTVVATTPLLDGRGRPVATVNPLVAAAGGAYPTLAPLRLPAQPTPPAPAQDRAEHHGQDGVAWLHGSCAASVGARAGRAQAGWPARQAVALTPARLFLRCRVLHPTPTPPDARERPPLGPVRDPTKVRAAACQTGVHVPPLAAAASPTSTAHAAVDAGV